MKHFSNSKKIENIDLPQTLTKLTAFFVGFWEVVSVNGILSKAKCTWVDA
jgi:hypothetical protein